MPGPIQWIPGPTAAFHWTGEPARPPDVPLVPGSIIGVRAWKVDRTDRLWPLGIRAAPPWEPGENQSRCFTQGGATEPCSPDCKVCIDAIALRQNGHTFNARCVCGFYGVFNPLMIPGSIDFSSNGVRLITGVVEVYGRMVLGPNGFRASKAKVLALIGDMGLDPKWDEVPRFSTMRRATTEFPITDPTQYLYPPKRGPMP
jgi:hypothetical protein